MKWTSLLLISLLLGGNARALERSFWVWNRPAPLDEKERAELNQIGVKTLYWEVAEAENSGDGWRWKKAPAFAQKSDGHLKIVPVVRLETATRDPFENTDALLRMLEEVHADSGSEELQIDYDAPDRLIGEYADFLKKVRDRVPKLSSTALAGWAGKKGFTDLQDAVQELFPMFYDLEPDTAPTLTPLLEPVSVKSRIEKWNRACKIPWRAGLPWFARVSVYDIAGKSRGHIPTWAWEDICFNRYLRVEKATEGGMTTLKADGETSVGSYGIKKGELVVVRWPDLQTLFAVEKTLSEGVVYFRLPNEAPESGWSLAQFRAMGEKSMPALTLRRGLKGVAPLELVNESDADLIPRLSGKDPLDRGYALEIDAPAAIFREAEPGDFWRVTAHSNPESQPVPAPVPLATRLTFWFGDLQAHHSLRINLLQLAPGAEFSQLRYRILGMPGDSSWRSLNAKNL